MRWTTKNLWLAALGAGLIAWPAWAQNTGRYDDESSSSRSSSRQYDSDDANQSGTSSSRQSRQSSSRDYSDDSDDYSSGSRTQSSSQSRQPSGSQAQRSGRMQSGSSQFDSDDDQWSQSNTGRSSTDRSTTGRSSTGRTTGQAQSRSQRNTRSDDESWFGMDGNQGQSSRSQWSDWDDEKDVQEANVWRASNLMGKSVQNSRGEDLGEIEDIVVDLRNKDIRYVAISYGGALGFGEKLFAVPLDQLRMQQDDDGNDIFVLNVDQNALENADGFEDRDSWPAQADASLGRGGRTQMARSSQQRGSQQSSFAQGSQQRSSQSSSMAQQGQQSGRSFQGEFEEYDEDADQLVVRTTDGRRRVYNVSPGVRVTSQGRRATLDDLEEGDQIRLSYTTDRNNRTTITAVEDSQQRMASRSQSQRYNAASYDPDSQDRSQSQRSQQRSSRDQWQDDQRSGTGYESSSSNYQTDFEDRSSSRNRSSSDSGQSGSSSSRQRSSSSDSSDDSSYSDDSDDDRSSSRSGSRSSSSSRSSDDSDSYDSEE